MGLKSLLKKCNKLYTELPCCHNDGRICSCVKCFEKDFYSRPDTYDCLKKLCYYTMNYGPAYASEIYHYLNKSKLLEHKLKKEMINVLSLGCGFSPDAYALKKYINNNELDIDFKYTGYDIEKKWEEIRDIKKNRNYETRNLLSGFSLENYDIIFMYKFFSTIKRNNNDKAAEFLKLLIKEISRMKDNTYLIFNDINHIDFGRDIFNDSVQNLFSEVSYYYFPMKNAYSKYYYQKIEDTDIVFSYPPDLKVEPKPYVNNSIIFEYRK